MAARGQVLGTCALSGHWVLLSLGWEHSLWLRTIPREGCSCPPTSGDTPGSQDKEYLGSKGRSVQAPGEEGDEASIQLPLLHVRRQGQGRREGEFPGSPTGGWKRVSMSWELLGRPGL